MIISRDLDSIGDQPRAYAKPQTTETMGSQFDFSKLGPLVMGGAGFSYQLHKDPEALPLRQILLRAFELGLRTIDTSPYYEPSEQLMGAALSSPEITSRYQRNDYILMTKAGRIKEDHFDYSPAWLKKSVARSLERFQTTYLDVVFCHDVEFVTLEEAVTAVGTLFAFKETGAIKAVGISGYRIDILAQVAQLVRERLGQPVDIVQNWAQLTLQNTRLELGGFEAFREAGVKAVVCSSPLAVGLLRYGGIPTGRTGDWHPSPQGMRLAAQQAAEWVHGQGQVMSRLAMRFAIGKAIQNSSPDFTITTASGISTMSDLEDNVEAAKSILRNFGSSSANEGSLARLNTVNEEELAKDQPYYKQVRDILNNWVDYDFAEPKPKEEKDRIEAVQEQTISARI